MMIKLFKNTRVYAPQDQGVMDVLICGDKIADVRPSIQGFDRVDAAEITDFGGAVLAPAYIDLHEHITGGGGEQGFSSRIPEIRLSEIALAGVATVVGLLGVDCETRSLENLYAKACALEEEGLTAFMLTGGYPYPAKTITGSVTRDIALIHKVVGVKTSIADHRSSGMTAQELIRLASEARIGGMISGKPGLIVLHLGDGVSALKTLFEAVENSEIPIGQFMPTHVSRNKKLMDNAVLFARKGGRVDFTAGDEGGTAQSIAYALEQGVDLSQITLSSDACGSVPVFDKQGNCVGMTYTSPSVLHEELLRMVRGCAIPLENALRVLTQNPAAALGLSGCKGGIAPGLDADLIVYDCDLNIRHVMAKGKWMVKDGKTVRKGRFETNLVK